MNPFLQYPVFTSDTRLSDFPVDDLGQLLQFEYTHLIKKNRFYLSKENQKTTEQLRVHKKR
ncbi:MAG: hypothetical protein Q8O06_03490, partial [Acetobacterium sp.]|nr:hypothetical protein [Acetobacterium sp.]